MANKAYGAFGLPQRRASRAPWIVLACLFALIVFGATCAWSTQSTAERLHYQDALGEPLYTREQGPVYWPWAVFHWRAELDDTPQAQELARAIGGQLELGALLACFGGVAIALGGIKRRRNVISSLHGSAKLAEKRDVEQAQLFSTEGVVVGGYEDPSTGIVRWCRNNGFNHTGAFGPTGSGKGIALVIPTLLTWKHSIIVHDPKGENVARSSGYRATLGPVYRLDFAAEPSTTAGFNPLDIVRAGTIYEAADAQRLAREVVDPDGKQFQSKNKHFVEGGASLISGAVVHLVYKHRALRMPPPCLYDVLIELTNEEAVEAWKDFVHDPQGRCRWYDLGEETPTHPFVKNAAEEYLNRKGDEKASILSSAVTPLALYRDPVLRANTSYSSFKPEELMDGPRPVSVYLVSRPEDAARSRPLTRILLGMLIGRLTPPMGFESGAMTAQHTHRLLMLLDEFPMLGRMDVIVDALAWIRGWGLTVYVLAQDYAQILGIYGKDETLMGALEFVSALRPNNLQTAEMLSKRAGKTTATIVMPGQKFGARSTYGQVGRDLLTPDEVMRLARAEKQDNKVIRGGDMLITGADRMVYGRQPLYFQDATLRDRSEMPLAPPYPADSPRPPRLDLTEEECEEAERIRLAIAAAVSASEDDGSITTSDPEIDDEPDSEHYEDPADESSSGPDMRAMLGRPR